MVERDPSLDTEEQTSKSPSHQEAKNQASLFLVSCRFEGHSLSLAVNRYEKNPQRISAADLFS